MNNNMTNCDEPSAMEKVMNAMFAVNDMTLYLDTHPKDRNALNLHNKYVKEYEDAKKEYESNYGPLSIFTEMDNWSWGCQSWPWEGGKM